MAYLIRRSEPSIPSVGFNQVRMKIERPLPNRINVQSGKTASLRTVSAGDQERQSFHATLQAKTAALTPSPSKERWAEYTIQPKDTLWALAVKRFHVNVEDLIKDNGIEDPKKIQPGQKIRVRLPANTGPREVVASWYGKEHHGKSMANGEPFDMHAATIAHKEIPLGTRVELENQVTGERVQATVTDRGPYIAGRDVDLSYGLAQKLSLFKQGVGKLVMRVLG